MCLIYVVLLYLVNSVWFVFFLCCFEKEVCVFTKKFIFIVLHCEGKECFQNILQIQLSATRGLCFSLHDNSQTAFIDEYKILDMSPCDLRVMGLYHCRKDFSCFEMRELLLGQHALTFKSQKSMQHLLQQNYQRKLIRNINEWHSHMECKHPRDVSQSQQRLSSQRNLKSTGEQLLFDNYWKLFIKTYKCIIYLIEYFLERNNGVKVGCGPFKCAQTNGLSIQRDLKEQMYLEMPYAVMGTHFQLVVDVKDCRSVTNTHLHLHPSCAKA